MGFIASGHPKNLPEAYVFVGFWAGPPKDRFLAEMKGLGPQNHKKGGKSPFWAKKGEGALKRVRVLFKYQVFPKENLMF